MHCSPAAHTSAQQRPLPAAPCPLHVERLLRLHPGAEVVVTGHSLGGALATLCAYDLLLARSREGDTPLKQPRVLLVSFAAPRMFNEAFQRAMSELMVEGRLSALRVVIGGDMVNRQ